MLAERMELLTKRPRGTLFPPGQNRAAWETLPADDRMDMETFIAKWRGTPYPMLLLSDYAAFVRTGSRAQCETPYFARRRKLIAAVLDVCLHGKSADMSAVEDGLWCICEETTWAISAHANLTAAHPFPISGEPILDLFAAQTAMVLSFTLTLLGDWLDSSLRQRVTAKIQRRAIDPFLHRNTDWWMGFTRKDLCNWTPWIVSNVMFSARCLLDDPLPVYRRACGMLDAYLRCIPADGGCDEGAAYWNMAAGSLLDCLELMAEAGLTCWDEPKLRNMLRFPLLMSLGNGYFANFADCDARPVMYGERLQRAGELLRDAPLTAMGQNLRGQPTDCIGDVPHFSRLLQRLFHPVGAGQPAADTQDTLLPDLQVRIIRRNGWTMCIKGGHNGESHNHNDVGSLMVYVDGHPLLVDAGNMVYTAKTFSDARYTLWNCRSMYHNVPLIGGFEQCAGAEYAARNFRALPDGASLDMAGAYPAEAGVLSAIRGALVTPDGVQIADKITLQAPEAVTFTMLAREKPEIRPDGIEFAHARMEISPMLAAVVEEIPVTDARMAKNWHGSLWRIALTAEAGRHHRLTIKISRNNFANQE